MTITEITTAPARFELVTFDLYKDIHKAIRAELFALVTTAAATDPSDRGGRCALAAHVADVERMLESHAEHEDAAIQPLLEIHLPDVRDQVAVDHLSFEGRAQGLVLLAAEAADAPAGDERRLLHLLHLDLASFTSSYLAHQDLEERVIMPGLEAAIGVEAVVGVHRQIIGSIPPAEMGQSLALMIPAMNIDDRTELLGGLQAGAPAEVFDGVWRLVGSLLSPADVAALASRLGLA
ncbi:MAG: hemerythrin domain-containing protein [Actinomycetota bacterium]|nr:hemerythrin domain-containing protein [Actinomycetota bacterium]